MDEKKEISIFHLFRKDGSPLFLYPFSTPGEFISMLDTGDVTGRYGSEPEVESLSNLRENLYKIVEIGIRQWLSEIRFIPKFLISAGIFLATFFFFAFVIPDPLPGIDEFFMALLASGAIFFFLGRRDQQSQEALKKRGELRAKIDKILFLDSDVVKQVEEDLQRNEEFSPEEMLIKITDLQEAYSFGEDTNDAPHMLQCFEKYFASLNQSDKERIVNKVSKGNPSPRHIKAIRKWADDKLIDLSLLAVYTRIKKTVNLKK